MKKKLNNQVFIIASNVFEENLKKINLNSNMKNIKNWDSVSHLNFLFSLEKEFGIDFDPMTIVKLTSIKNIINYISKQKKTFST